MIGGCGEKGRKELRECDEEFCVGIGGCPAKGGGVFWGMGVKEVGR